MYKSIIALVILLLGAVKDGKIDKDEAKDIFSALVDIYFSKIKKAK